LSYLLDTNILSEVRKGARAHAAVATWFDSVAADRLFLSVVTLGEVRRGIEIVARTDRAQAAALERWRGRVVASWADRILPVTEAVAEEWGRIQARRSVSAIDALLAATAAAHGLTIVTRNVRDFAGTGVTLLDPFR
jgi:predicted nucleic acid-binding protein